MKKIDNMTVTVTYTVVLNDVEVPDCVEYDPVTDSYKPKENRQ